MSSLSRKAIKVNRETLITHLEAHIGNSDKRFAQAKKDREARIAKAHAEIEEKLKRAKATDGKVSDYGGPIELEIHSNISIPRRPKIENACELNKIIEVLKMSTEESVSITPDQYQEFFPCEVN